MRLIVPVMVFSAVVVWADTKTVTKNSFNGRETVTTQYEQGEKQRIEYNDGKQTSVTIRVDPKTSYELDLAAHTYVERIFPAPGAKKIETYPSHKQVNIFFETVDTGERKEMLGHTAQHLILKTRVVPDEGACTQKSESETEGWYIAKSGPKPKYAFMVGFGGGMHDGRICQDERVYHGSFPNVLAVSVKNRSNSTEVVEYSEAPLEKGLFEIPEGFTKVDALPQPGEK